MVDIAIQEQLIKSLIMQVPSQSCLYRQSSVYYIVVHCNALKGKKSSEVSLGKHPPHFPLSFSVLSYGDSAIFLITYTASGSICAVFSFFSGELACEILIDNHTDTL